MIKVLIDDTQIRDAGMKAAFTIVKDSVQKSLKKIEPDVRKERGTVEVRVTRAGSVRIDDGRTIPTA